jgi:hypothetical protein
MFSFPEWISVVVKLWCSGDGGKCMHFMYGVANGSASEALCQEWFPNHRILGNIYVQQESSVFQRQWNICIESNGPGGAMTS